MEISIQHVCDCHVDLEPHFQPFILDMFIDSHGVGHLFSMWFSQSYPLHSWNMLKQAPDYTPSRLSWKPFKQTLLGMLGISRKQTQQTSPLGAPQADGFNKNEHIVMYITQQWKQ